MLNKSYTAVYSWVSCDFISLNGVLGVSYLFTVCVSLVLDSKYMQFRTICSLLCSIIVYIFKVDSNSIQYEKHVVKPLT